MIKSEAIKYLETKGAIRKIVKEPDFDTDQKKFYTQAEKHKIKMCMATKKSPSIHKAKIFGDPLVEMDI